MNRDPKQGSESAEVIGSVLSIYATMIHGHICSSDSLTPEDKVAALLCAGEVLHQTHALVLLELGKSAPNASPSWILTPEKLTSTAELYARRMVTGAK